ELLVEDAERLGVDLVVRELPRELLVDPDGLLVLADRDVVDGLPLERLLRRADLRLGLVRRRRACVARRGRTAAGRIAGRDGAAAGVVRIRATPGAGRRD